MSNESCIHKVKEAEQVTDQSEPTEITLCGELPRLDLKVTHENVKVTCKHCKELLSKKKD